MGDDVINTNDGAVYILYLDPSPNATAIKDFVKLGRSTPDPTGFASLAPFDVGAAGETRFGASLAALADVSPGSPPGPRPFAVGALYRDPAGAVWVVQPNANCSDPSTCTIDGAVCSRSAATSAGTRRASRPSTTSAPASPRWAI